MPCGPEGGERASDEVALTREHLIRPPIAELAAQLDAAQFVQVHRSTIGNLDHVAGTRCDEPGGLLRRVRGPVQELSVSRAQGPPVQALQRRSRPGLSQRKSRPAGRRSNGLSVTKERS